MVEISTNILVDDCDGLDAQYQKTKGISSLTVEANLVELVKKIEHLECKLEEALNEVKTKESEVLELEVILDRTGNEVDNTDVSLIEEKCQKMEVELANLIT
ncbi:WPP domain-interacting protein 1-like [Canna indica]|uniref:WPP domain-interacting protein 1-like n=1 Tax=Canna indica TaxID=4628 RepID=A0AAQ3QIJ0_9LILI|nr:WPP domain-interacting protein 1-like [Canna indica]